MKVKSKMKNYLKLGILLFGILFVLSNCMNEDFNIEEEKLETKLAVKKINLKTFTSNKIISKSIKLLSSKFDINKKHDKSNITLDDYTFTILTDEILEVTKDNITTYTFRIETPTDTISSFENLMVEKKNDTLNFFLYKFRYDETYSDFFPYQTTIQNIDENQINSENFNDYLKKVVFTP